MTDRNSTLALTPRTRVLFLDGGQVCMTGVGESRLRLLQKRHDEGKVVILRTRKFLPGNFFTTEEISNCLKKAA